MFLVLWKTKLRKKFNVTENQGQIVSISEGRREFPLNEVDEIYLYHHRENELIAFHFYRGTKFIPLYLTSQDGEFLLKISGFRLVEQIIQGTSAAETDPDLAQGLFNQSTKTIVKENISKTQARKFLHWLLNESTKPSGQKEKIEPESQDS